MYRFIVLVPHAGARAEFNKYRRELLCGEGGVSGIDVDVYTFPAVVPVALVQNPVSKNELKGIAASFRLQSHKNGGGGKISAAGMSFVEMPDEKRIAGPRLSIEPPPIPAGIPVLKSFTRLVFGVGIHGAERERCFDPPAGAINFGAAAIANMTLRELEYERSYSWTIGEPQWLPSRRLS